MNIAPIEFFSKAFCRVKTGEVDGYLKRVKQMVMPTNHIIARDGFTLREALGTLEIFATFSCQI